MFDVLIAGGGPAGLAAATALAQRNVSVAVVDPAAGLAAPRAELLAQGAEPVAHRLGLEHALARAVKIDAVESHWGAAGLQSHGAHPGLGLHGWGISRKHLSIAMVQRVSDLGVRIIEARITNAQKTARGWFVKTGTGSDTATLHARYVIDATGRPAHIARRQSATVLHGPDLVAVLWRTPRPKSNVMQAEAVAEGWWYSVPHQAGGTVAFVTSSGTAKQVSGSSSAFLAQARDTLNLIDVRHATGPTRLMDCRSAVLDQASGPGWHATGDAAAAFDPISSQGLFNALSGGFFAGHAAADALAGDEDAPKVFEALASRTAERTHSTTHLQYAALPFDTAFWRHRARGGLDRLANTAVPA
ncbi:tryptophan 7-halogenase [uncultured Tateyamaria sp.]|uniref:NAD(P)/FAD-dependent oxidoreductase n=1 Tax=uncultured Tateyamaria sp. TaxID=455651 RepID=UPI0026181F84|nr:tryptophan 7-halogenase [uncultured Tateyamaria sp.]